MSLQICNGSIKRTTDIKRGKTLRSARPQVIACIGVCQKNRMSNVEETTYLNEKNCVVTSTRVVLAGTTYATRNVSSVRLVGGKVSWLAILVVMMGFPMAMVDNVYGWGVMAAGAAWFYYKFSTWQLMMNTSGTDQLALTTNNKTTAKRIHDAIAQAIAAR